MLVSVIIPVYNTQQYLEKCLSSVVNQSLSDIEIICVDDRSTDKSYDILTKWGKTDNRIKIYSNDQNMGLSVSRNVGVQKAHGKYVFFLDSDDYIDRNTLEILTHEISYRNGEMLGFEFIEEYENIQNKIKLDDFDSVHTYTGIEVLEKCTETGRYWLTAWSYLYEKHFLTSNNIMFQDGILHEDSLFHIRCLLKAKRISFINEALYHYRRNGASITKSAEKYLERLESLCVIYNEVGCLYNNEVKAENKALVSRFLNHISHSAGNVYKMIDSFPDKYEPRWEIVDEILPLLQGGFYNGYFPRKLTASQMNLLRNKRYVLIYGAGEVGKGFEKLLIERKINNYIFVVSDDKHSEYDGIDDYKNIADEVVVVIASTKERKKMLNKALSLGFESIIVPRI